MITTFRGAAPLFILLAGFLIAGLLVFPQYEEIGQLRSNVKEQREKRNQLAAETKRFEDYTGSLESVKAADRELVEYALPGDIDIPDLMMQMERIVAQNNLLLRGIGISSSTSAPGTGTVPTGSGIINLDLSGSYGALKQFFSTVTMNRRVMNPASVQFQPGDKSEVYNFSVTLSTYFVPKTE